MSQRALRTIVGRLALALLLGLAVLSGLVWAGFVPVPNRLNPFAPLVVADPPNWLTRMKLTRLEFDAPQCFRVLRDTPVVHARVPDRTGGEGCGVEDGVQVTRSSLGFSGSFVATCRLAVAWALFETHVLRPEAARHLGREVASVVHFGTYACRNINHRERGRRSEHASANAIDIAGFVLEDGRRITLAADWTAGNAAERAFLRAVRDGACRFFDVVLSPDYNEAHRDHFHFDMGPFRACR